MQSLQKKNSSKEQDFNYIDIQDDDDDIEKNEENTKLYQEYLNQNGKAEKPQRKQKKQPKKKKFYNVSEMKDISEEDRPFIILDADTGQYFDIRIHEDEISQSSIFDTEIVSEQGDDDIVWKEFWERVKLVQEQLQDAVHDSNPLIIKKVLDITKQQKIPVDINYKGLDDETLLHIAASEGHLDNVKLLVEYQANVDAKTIFNRTPLHLAALRGFAQIITFLIQNGALIDIEDKQQYTPLHYACEFGCLESIDVLLKHKANVNIKTYQGVTALETVQSKPKIWKIFEKYGYQKLPNYNYERKNFVDKMLQNKPGGQPPSTNAKSTYIEEKVSYQDFNVYDVLGKGAFGKVFLVKKKEVRDGNQQYFAMKQLLKDKILQNHLERYANVEKNVMAIMNHPFIVRLHYSFQTEVGLFLVMQFCSGGDMCDLLDRKDKLDEQSAKIYLAQVLLALEALHRNNIIFRDLKPANILLDQDGNALLADFGLANHRIDKDDYDNNLRQSFLGTPAYLAPEMVRKAGHNRMIDWYLLGVLLYEFLTGITPYYANTKEELFKNILKGPLKMPSKGISDLAKDLIVKLLNRNPKKRLGYQTDAEEIKKHPFFNDIDWNKVYNKEYKMEKPIKKSLPTEPIDINVNNASGRGQSQSFEGWSFVNRN